MSLLIVLINAGNQIPNNDHVVKYSIPTSFSWTDKYFTRGCCSHHGGVCGCSANGRVQCCDGTKSPSCGCNSGDVSLINNTL